MMNKHEGFKKQKYYGSLKMSLQHDIEWLNFAEDLF